MKIELNVNDVLTPITHAASVVASKSVVEIFSCLQWRKDATQEGMMTVTASDGEVWLMMSTPIMSCDVDAFNVCIEAKEILPLLRMLKGQNITLHFDETTHTVKCSYAKGHGEMPYQDGKDFPQPKPTQGETMKAIVKVSNMFRALDLTRGMMANDDLRPILNGVHLDVKKDEMVAVATDAHRLVKTTFPLLSGVEEKVGMTIPSKAVNILLPLLSRKDIDMEDPVDLSFTASSLCVECSGAGLVCRLPEGRYPNYESVIPREGHDNVLVIDKKAMTEALGRVLLLCNEKTQMVRLSLSPLTGVTLMAEDMDFATRGTEQVDGEYVGEDMEIGFKGDYLVQTLDNIPSDKAKVMLRDTMHSGVFYPTDVTEGDAVNYVSILMPMRIG